MTVSCALRDDPRVRPDTKAKILKVANALGYRPDPELSKLMTYLRRPDRLGEAHRIALINPFPNKDHFHAPGYEGMIYEGAVERAKQQGYKIEEFWLGQKGMSSTRLSSIIKSRGIEALFLPPWPGIGVQESLSWEDFAIASASDSFWKPSVHRAFPNAIFNTRLMLYHVRRLGYRHLGIIIPRHIDRRLHCAPSMAMEWYVRHKLRNCKIDSFDGSLDKKDDFERWLTQTRPEVIVSFEPKPLRRMIEMGISIPDEIGFVCQDVSVLNRNAKRLISGVNPRPDLIGATTVDLIVGQLARNERGVPGNARVVMLEGDWIQGETLNSKKSKT